VTRVIDPCDRSNGGAFILGQSKGCMRVKSLRRVATGSEECGVEYVIGGMTIVLERGAAQHFQGSNAFAGVAELIFDVHKPS